MENLGWRHDLSEAYKRSSLLIRFTDRDGLSLMVLEALGFGRHVLWTQEFQHTRNIRTYDDMEREVLELLQAHERGTLEPQRDAAAFIRERYSPEQCMRAIATAWQDTLLTDSAPAIVLGTP
jgi:glycosyltransferase involved in cell wall biosynthesis